MKKPPSTKKLLPNYSNLSKIFGFSKSPHILNLEELAALAATYHSKGWLPATAGNLSVRDAAGNIHITASGLDKGNLQIGDFIDLNNPSESRKPSAETAIHLAIYRTIPETGCVVHLHTLESNLLKFKTGKQHPVKKFVLPENEIIKAFGFGLSARSVPVIYNFDDVGKIGQSIESLFFAEKPVIPFLIIENHGITVWGRDIKETDKHIQAADFLLQLAVGG